MTDEKDKRIMPPPMRMVAVEPTEAMLAAGRDITEHRLAPAWTARNVWSAMLAASPPPGELREVVEAILSRGFIGQQSRIHGGQWYVIGLDGERFDALYDSGDEAEAALIKHLTDAILSAIGAGHE